MHRALELCSSPQLWHHVVRALTTQASTDALPIRFGSMTTRIRRIHDVHLLQWAVSGLAKRNRPIPCKNVCFTEDKTTKIFSFYQNPLTFFRTHHKLFYVKESSNAGTNLPTVELRRPKGKSGLDQADLSDALHVYLPPMGCLPLSFLAFLANRSHPNKVLSVFDQSASLQKLYTIVVDKYNEKHFYRQVDVPFSVGHFHCANNSVATALEAAHYLMPTMPTHWVPIALCFQRLTKHTTFVQNHGYRKIEGILRGAVESSYYQSTLFVRRTDLCANWKDIPECTQKYEGFDLFPLRVLKIVFSLPEQPTSVDKCWDHMFPSIAHWFYRFPAFDLTQIARMFPEVMQIDEENKLRSLIRSKYPAVTSRMDHQTAEAAEKAFDDIFGDPQNASVLQTLTQLVAEPSSAVFTLNDSFQRCMEHRCIAKENDVYTKKQLFDFINECIREEELIPWANIRDRLENLVNIDRKRLSNTLNSLNIRRTPMFLRFIEENQPCPLGFKDDQIPGRASFQVLFCRKDPNALEEGNEYLDPRALIAEIRHSIRVKHKEVAARQHCGHYVGLPWVATSLPLRARIALRSFGGITQFLKTNSEIFGVDRRGRVWLMEDVPKTNCVDEGLED